MKKKSLTVYHLSATENTLRKMPKFNPYQTGHGVIGDTKYNRRKTKRELRKLIDEQGWADAHERYMLSMIDQRLSRTHMVGYSSLRGYRHCVPQNHPPSQGRAVSFYIA